MLKISERIAQNFKVPLKILIAVVVLTYQIFDTPPSTKELNCPPLNPMG